MKKLSFIVCSFLFASNIFGDVYWTNSSGDGEWGTGSNWSTGSVPPQGETAIFQDVGGTVSITSDAVIRTIRVNGSTPVTLNIASGVTLSLANRGSAGLLAIGADLTVEGYGQLALSTNEGTDSQATNHLDNGARAGRTLTINTQIIPGQTETASTTQTGFESWIDTPPGGDIVLGHTASAFTMNMNLAGGHIVSTVKLGAAGQPSSLGAINAIIAAANTAIRYTGAGDTAGYEFRVNGSSAIVQDGTGTLIWGGPIFNMNASAQTVTLRGGTTGRVTGAISNNPGALAVTKDGSGTWTLAGANTFTGPIAINGGTLGLDSTTAAGGAPQITMLSGTTLRINPSATPGFTATFPAVSASGSVTINIDAATSAVTFQGLAAASVNIIATVPGTTIKITGMQDGRVAPWLTLNGNPATYDQTTGLAAATTIPTQSLKTRDDTLPDGAALTAVIDTLETTGSLYIDMPTDSTLYSLKQTVTDAGGEATVNLNNGTFMATELAIAADAKALTVGAQPQDGTFLPPIQIAPPAGAVDSTAISNLNPIVWYDPSERETVTLSVDVVTGLANKGSLEDAMDAVPRSNGTGPTYVTGPASHSTLPMLKIDANSQALHSLGVTGISGNSGRTLFAVMSRGTAGNEFPVGFGANADAQDFTINMQPNNLNTRFNTWAGDRDVGTPNIGQPFVATFFNNSDGNTPNTLSAAVDSAPAQNWDAKDSNLRTASTTFKIGHRHAEANSGRGQAGEILLFARTLDATERGIVEAYLTAKWLQPKSSVVSQSALVTLRNESTAGDLTVNAAVIEPEGGVVSLVKVGEGNVALAGGANFSGPVTIGEGTLTVATPGTATDLISGIISGSGHLTKDGPGMLVLPLSTANQYTGGTDILGGTLRIGNSRSLSTGAITIADGATLDLGSGSADAIVINNRVTVSGEGVDNAGAIVNNSAVQQRNAFQNTTVTLADDASFGGAAVNWDFRGGSILDFAGHTLTKVGAADLRFSPSTFSNAPAGKAVHIKQGHLGLESGMILHPNTPAPEIHIDSGARFGVYQKALPTEWTLVPADGAEISAFGNTESLSQNVFNADMALPAGTVKLTANGSFNKSFTGQISGPGGLIVSNGGFRAMSLLAHPNNTFAGNVAVHNAILGLRHPGSLPGGLATLTDRLTFETLPAGVRAFMGGANGWGSGDIEQLAESGIFNASTTYLQIHVDANESGSIDDDIGSPFLGMLDKFGAGTLALNGNVEMGSASIRTFAGTLAITNGATVSLNANHLYIGDAIITDGTAGINNAIIGSNSKLTSTDLGRTIQNGPQVCLAAHNSKSVLELKDTAEVTAKIMIGGTGTGDTSAFGALYQSGGSFLSTGGGSNDGRIGIYGYGYYQLGGGTLTLKGWTQLGWSATSVGILHQTGGAFAFNGKRYLPLVGAGVVGESYDGSLGLSRGGTGILHLEGGTFEHYGELRLSDTSDNSNSGGTAIMTVDGSADVMIDREIQIGYRTNGVATLNLNGGKLTTTFINRMPAPSASTVNFNGGTLCVTNNTGNTRLFAGTDASPLNAYVYDGGAVIELGANVTRTLDIPLQQPDGSGVKAIHITNGGTGYIAPPHITITGGDGSGATAITRIDRATGAVIGIEVTNPGRGYTSTPTVATNAPVSSAAGGTGLTIGIIERAGSTLGGLTKTGAGTLVLNAPNPYPGPTVVSNGVLRIGHPEAIPAGSHVIIGDGMLDLAGHTITCASVTIEGTGSIANGKVITASAVKTGDGTGAWDAAIEFADVDTAIPGLWEGMFKGTTVDNYWNTTSPNPRFAIQPTTRAANGGIQAPNGTYANNLWNGGYHTWAYSGYIWNRATTNVQWTFFGRFDDRLTLTIDDIVIFNNIGNGGDTFRTVLLPPGPHAFDLRLGDGSGDAGPGPKDRTVFPATGPMSGLLVDYSGQPGSTAALDRFQILEDDGYGTLFTATLGNAADTAIRVEAGTLLLPAPEPGLWEGWLTDGRASTSPNPMTSVELTTTAANGFSAGVTVVTDPYDLNGKTWMNNTAYVYTGYIWNRDATNVTWTFAENFDDDTRLTIDGTPVLSNTEWATATIGSITLTPGPHAFEVRFGQGSGGVGCPNPQDATVIANSDWWKTFARSKSFVVDFYGRNEKDAANYDNLVDSGNGMLLSLTPLGALPDLSGLTINVSSNATLDIGGIPRDGLTVIGGGHITNGVFGTSSILSPAGDHHTGSMTLNGLTSLDGLTYHLTVHDYSAGQSDNQPGLRESALGGAFNIMDPNTGTTVEPTVTAANGGFDTATPPNYIQGKPWPHNTTYVYTGYIWNRTGAPAKWTFAEHFDDSVLLIINNTVILNDSTWGTPTKGNATLKPGPNTFEVRFGQGTGGGGCPGPTGSLWWDGFNRATAFAVDFEGRDSTVAANYTILTEQAVADVNGGPLFTVTGHINNDAGRNDVITSVHPLDLTGLTIIPSDGDSVSPTGNNYVIATAPSFTGVPTVKDFTGKKWKTLRKGNTLLLTTQGGTVIILK